MPAIMRLMDRLLALHCDVEQYEGMPRVSLPKTTSAGVTAATE